MAVWYGISHAIYRMWYCDLVTLYTCGQLYPHDGIVIMERARETLCFRLQA